MGSSKKCEKSWKIYSVSKKWTLTMEKCLKSDVYQKKKKNYVLRKVKILIELQGSLQNYEKLKMLNDWYSPLFIE